MMKSGQALISFVLLLGHSIGFAQSHGCIRLRNRDVEQLFERVRTGDVVELHAERTPEIVRLFGK